MSRHEEFISLAVNCIIQADSATTNTAIYKAEQQIQKALVYATLALATKDDN